MTTDQAAKIPTAKVDAADRERIAAGLLLLVDPADALEAAIARIAYLEERNDELQEDLARLAWAAGVGDWSGDDVAGRIVAAIGKLSEERDVARADVVRLTAERNSDRMAAHEEQRRCTAAVSEARGRIEDLQRAIARIVTCPPEEEHAAMADARLLVGEEAIARYAGATSKPDAQPVATVEPMTEADRQRRLRAERNEKPAPSKPESQPVATVEPAPTKVDRYVVVSRGNIPPGTPPDRLAWFSPSGGSEVRVCKALNDGTIDRGELEWGALELGGAPLNGPFGILDRGEPIGEEG